MTTIYGIPNCDTVKKARKWLEANNIAYQFHDFRKDGLTKEQLSYFVEKTAWDALLNKRSTSFRNLPDTVKDNLDEQSAIQAMLAEPTLIKRPVLSTGEHVLIGFKSEQYDKQFG